MTGDKNGGHVLSDEAAVDEVPTAVDPSFAPMAAEFQAAAGDHPARLREAIPRTVVLTTTSRSGRRRVRRQVLITLNEVEAAVERALARGHAVAVVTVRVVPLDAGAAR